MLSDGTWSYTWQHGRQLASMAKSGTNISYAYNSDGLRTSKTVNGTTTKYLYNGSQLIGMDTEFGTVYFHYDATGVMAMEVQGTMLYYAKNAQGDVMALVDTNGYPVVKYSYDAWGNITDTTGIYATTFGQYNPFRYRGYVYDDETGLYYLQSRYYNPEMGRFVNADDVSCLGADGTLLSYNLFAYCDNNPIMNIDSIGTFSFKACLKGAGWLSTGITAVCVGVSVLTCGVAAPAMMAIAAVTVVAGTATVVNGVSEIGEAATGHNFMRDTVFRGNAKAYSVYAHSTATVAAIGTAICGGWMQKNAPRIEAYKNVQNYRYSDSAAKHIGERSYYNSTILKKQIIKYGKMTCEGRGVYTFRAGGTAYYVAKGALQRGTWELTTINSLKMVGHFLLRS